ncbi:MAG TPA: thiamine diphosphokinase [Candidatus Woesebacteria bacterium]|nr:thiamine diphosphokinase [Candidatus Woesebacteria bacterium]
MKKALILINGNLSTVPNLKTLLKTNDLLICADGGAEYAYQQELIPNVIIGDLDSINNNIKLFYKKKKVLWLQFPQEKDLTDTELAIQYALQEKVDEIILCGLLGDRVDHILATIFNLSKIAQKVPCIIMEGNSNLHFVSSSISIQGSKGDEISLIPLNEDCIGVATQGLYYPLKQETLPYGSTRGISNVFIKKNCTITVQKGILLIIHKKTLING